jgi:PEP-CTERM motif
MMTTPRIRLVTVLASLSLSVLTAAAHADSVTTFEDSIIQPGGPRTTNGGTTLVDYFFNAEGSGNAGFSSFAVADFSGLHLGISSLGQLSQFQLQLTEDNAAFTAPGLIGVYLSTDTTTNIGLGSPLRFQSSATPQGLGSQLNNAVNNLLGSFQFPTTGGTNQGQLDTIDLSPGLSHLSSSAQTALLNALDSGGTIRLVVAPENAPVAATYAGINDFTHPNGAPTLVASAVPEPSSIVLIGLGLVGVAVASRHALIRTRRSLS